MVDTARIALVASVALAAGLVAACVCPSECPPTRCAGSPIADVFHEPGPATLSIEGVVKDEQGLPIPAVWIGVEGHPKPGQSPPDWRTDVHGRFRIDGLPPGRKTLIAGKGSTAAQTKRVDTQAGARDLVIVLDPGPQLLLRIVGHVPGAKERGLHVTWQDGVSRDVRWTPIREDGWARMSGLPAEHAFEVWAPIDDDGRLVRAQGLKPGVVEQRIESDGFEDIVGRVRASAAVLETTLPGNFRGPLREHLELNVYSDSGYRVLFARSRVRDDGVFRISGLPPGTYRIQLIVFAEFIASFEQEIEAGTTDVVFDLAGDFLARFREGSSD